jgi:hypothetical protein
VYAAQCCVGLRRCVSSLGPRVWQIAALSALVKAAEAFADAAQAAHCFYWPSSTQLKLLNAAVAFADTAQAQAPGSGRSQLSQGFHVWPMVALSRLLFAAVTFAGAAPAQAQITALCMLLDAALAFADAAQIQATGSGRSQPSQC